MSKEVIKQYIHDVLKDIKLEWTFKERAIRSIIQKNLGEFIDEVIKENKDFVDFFL